MCDFPRVAGKIAHKKIGRDLAAAGRTAQVVQIKNKLMTSLVLISLVIFLAALIKATLGFGESLLAMPLLTLMIGLPAATPLVALVATTLTLLMLGSSWRKIDLRS